MQLSYKIFLVMLIGNLAFMGAMLLAQALNKDLPPRHSIIPGTNQKFLYIQDFYTMTWGDLFGVLLIANAFAHLVVKNTANLWWAIPIMVISALLFMMMNLGAGHKPDYGYPGAGEISFAGVLHLIYFGVGVGASLICAWNLVVTGELRGTVMWLGLAGGAFYIGCTIADIKSGNFDPIHRIQPLDTLYPTHRT